jgi:hypothetical protein
MKIAGVLLVAIMGIADAYAQQAVPASGGNATGSGGSASYTIGQVGYVTAVGAGGTSQQGVQQAYDFVVVSAPAIEEVTIAISVFPNPAIDRIVLDVEVDKLKNPSFHLFDMNGKRIRDERIAQSQTSIPMDNVASGMYFLTVMDGEKEMKKFKVIKHR